MPLSLAIKPTAAALLAALLTCAASAFATEPSSPLKGNVMWIWEVPKSSGGNLDAIAARARAHHMDALILKAADAGTTWRQFAAPNVAKLKRTGLRVCGYQFVYGTHPEAEAAAAARVVAAGADCLVVDAEGQYEGKYAAAQTYVKRVRAKVGGDYPIVLSGFPYVDYHPGFPYSVFLGPGGAQYSAPQMYWKDIGTSVDQVFAHTYQWNRFYRRPILPIGQLYQDPKPDQVLRFRQAARAYGADGISWWDYQEATRRGFKALRRSVPAPLVPIAPAPGHAPLQRGGKGDPVVWAQQHLAAAGQIVPIDGRYGTSTQSAVSGFQLASGLSPSGVLDSPTWDALLTREPAAVIWSRSGTATLARARGARPLRLAPPASAALPGRPERGR